MISSKENMQEIVKNQVCKYRLQKKLTQEELGNRVGVSRQTIIALEKGNYAPSILLALKIAAYYEVPVENIFKIPYEK